MMKTKAIEVSRRMIIDTGSDFITEDDFRYGWNNFSQAVRMVWDISVYNQKSVSLSWDIYLSNDTYKQIIIVKMDASLVNTKESL